MSKAFLMYWIENPDLDYKIHCANTWTYDSYYNFYEFVNLVTSRSTDDLISVYTKRGPIKESRRKWNMLIRSVR
jgi:hypothetical protein